MIKSKEEMLSSVLTNLRTQGGITETAKGSAARLIVETLIEEFYPLYEELDIVNSSHSPSTARGLYLDEYGELLQLERLEDESDDDYRVRIFNQVPSLQSGSRPTLDFQLRQIEGVQDIQLVPFTHAPGSFTCYVFPTVFPASQDLLRQVEEVLEKYSTYGVKFFIEVPKAIPVDIYLSIVFNSTTTNAERNFIRSSITAGIKKMMSQLGMGETLVINQIGHIITNSSPKVLDYALYGLTVNDQRRYIQNVKPRQDEQLVARTINIQ